jgi:hypothetical protein
LQGKKALKEGKRQDKRWIAVRDRDGKLRPASDEERRCVGHTSPTTPHRHWESIPPSPRLLHARE